MVLLPPQDPAQWLAALAINGLLIALAQRLPLLTRAGWVHAGVLGTLLWGSLGWRGWLAVVAYLAFGSLVTKLGFRRKRELGLAEGREGRRERVSGPGAHAPAGPKAGPVAADLVGALPLQARGVAPHHLEVVVGAGVGLEEVNDDVDEVQEDPGGALVDAAPEGRDAHPAQRLPAAEASPRLTARRARPGRTLPFPAFGVLPIVAFPCPSPRSTRSKTSSAISAPASSWS